MNIAELRTQLEETAKQVLRSRNTDPENARTLASSLSRARSFGWARKVLSLARENGSLHPPRLALELAQLHALCTYKDPDQPVDARLDRGLEILAEVEDLSTTENQETLGLAGAMYKRKWELDGHTQHLYRSLSFYERGFRQGVAQDQGYNAINAAFVLDILASMEESQATTPDSMSSSVLARRSEAARIRTEIVTVLPALSKPDTWWFPVTIAEAYLGLADYENAGVWLRRAALVPDVPAWEREATLRQLAQLLRQQPGAASELKQNPGWTLLQDVLGANVSAVRSAFSGKVGLALSGGGFRASIYHIGVLAKMAELDMLRHVEVISCVSGGSIIGAHYYLEVRHLLQTKADDAITRDDYIAIVRRIATEFLKGVQRNIRTRVAAEFATNLRMLLSRNYSRTQRAGELYERELFARVPDGLGQSPRYMHDLLIQPLGELDFSPKSDNWRRRAKAPILILNATTLNTGHNWQFTATWMGEPPAGLDSEIDANDRFRRMYYAQAPPAHRKIRLGHAVAASACVPGLFEPLMLDGLYPERTVGLVDGGVYDNQGIGGLLEQECTVMLVSDASGQMRSEKIANNGLLAVPLRSNTIFQARLRSTQYHDLDARRRSSLLRGFMFIHLKKDLSVEPVNWIGCDEPSVLPVRKIGNVRLPEETSYGVRSNVQRYLAEIRTDLDSFCNVEAWALMVSGYRMTGYELARRIEGFETSSETTNWEFLAFEKNLENPGKRQKYISILKAAHFGAFKIWKLRLGLKALALVLAISALTSVGVYGWSHWESPISFTIGMAASPFIVAALGRMVGPYLIKLTSYRKTIYHILLGVAMCLVGFAVARLHLYIFDQLYLRHGRE